MNSNYFIFILFILLLGGCGQEKLPQLVENTGYAQGSTFQIKYYSPGGKDYSLHIDSVFKAIDNSMSTYVDNSLISKVNKGGVWVKVDSAFLEVLTRSLEIASETDGLFDPTIGPLVKLWGFSYEEIKGDITEENIEHARSLVGYEKVKIQGDSVTIPMGFSIDFNAIAQGYTVDVIAEFLEAKNIVNYMVEVGGEVNASGAKDNGEVWRIGVDKPQDQVDKEERFQFIVKLSDAALATSGNYRKYWIDEETGVKYSHTINPYTGKPARNRLLSASIITTSGMDADAYATVCMVKGLDECRRFLSEREDLEGYLIYSEEDGEWGEYITEGFPQMVVE